MNILLQLGISIFLWLYVIRSVINNNGFIGSFINKIGNSVLPNGILNLSGPFVILIVFFIIYALLFYVAIWKDRSRKTQE